MILVLGYLTCTLAASSFSASALHMTVTDQRRLVFDRISACRDSRQAKSISSSAPATIENSISVRTLPIRSAPHNGTPYPAALAIKRLSNYAYTTRIPAPPRASPALLSGDSESRFPLDLTQLTYFRGRVALAAILRGLGVRAGNEVLLQAFTCIAVPEAILSLGAIPRYVDLAAGSPNMDADDLRQKLGPMARAVIVQHTFGLPADVTRLAEIARERGVPLIEDCAHTIASRVDGRAVGSFGAAAFYSFEASKPVFVGIGGSATSNDHTLSQAMARDYPRYIPPPRLMQFQLEAMRLAHRVAYRPSTYWTVRALFRAVVATGLIRGNYNKVADMNDPGTAGSANDEASPASPDFARRMGALQVGLLRSALSSLDEQSAHRRWVGEQYRAGIDAAGAEHFPVAAGVEPVFGRYPLVVEDRAALLDGARGARVELADFYATPVHPLKGQELRQVGYEPGSCPRAEWLSDRIVSLPTGRQVNAKQIDRAVNFFNGNALALRG